MSERFTSQMERSSRRSYNEPFFDNKIDPDEKLLTKKEIADFLNVSIKTIDKKVCLNEIPYFKIGRLVRFSKKKVLTWAEGNP